MTRICKQLIKILIFFRSPTNPDSQHNISGDHKSIIENKMEISRVHTNPTSDMSPMSRRITDLSSDEGGQHFEEMKMHS
jgi:hypothetical protein